ncbi:uncharacterized protein ARMOST_02869 [Armillaria ostoyae]|uniref:Uncharacterized protein n=1 Tax=Armillaria ostoyae TaxID=47428 RepID=A0A284QT39_ARMOS|nr:uncharacterized protein ARMOST_02869 [Armillaria ostoyae]
MFRHALLATWLPSLSIPCRAPNLLRIDVFQKIILAYPATRIATLLPSTPRTTPKGGRQHGFCHPLTFLPSFSANDDAVAAQWPARPASHTLDDYQYHVFGSLTHLIPTTMLLAIHLFAFDTLLSRRTMILRLFLFFVVFSPNPSFAPASSSWPLQTYYREQGRKSDSSMREMVVAYWVGVMHQERMLGNGPMACNSITTPPACGSHTLIHVAWTRRKGSLNAEALEPLPPFPTLVSTSRRSGSAAPTFSIRAGAYNLFPDVFFKFLSLFSYDCHARPTYTSRRNPALEGGGSRQPVLCTACRSSARVVLPRGAALSNMTFFRVVRSGSSHLQQTRFGMEGSQQGESSCLEKGRPSRRAGRAYHH